MHRVDSPDFVVIDGKRYYKETPTPATVFGYHQANAIQEEIADVIESEGLTLRSSGSVDAANNYKGQLNSAINKKITDAYNLSRNLNILPTSYPIFPVEPFHLKDKFFIGVTKGIGLLKGVGSNSDYFEEFDGIYPGGIGYPGVINFSRVFTDEGENTWAQYNPANPDPDVGCVPSQASGWAGFPPQLGRVLHVYLVKSPNFSSHTNRLMVVVDRTYPAPNNILSIDPSITHYMYAGMALVDNPGEAPFQIAPFIRQRYYHLWNREFWFTRLNFAQNIVGTGTSFSQEHTVEVDCISYGPVMVDLEVTLDYVAGAPLLDNVSEKVAVEISPIGDLSGVNKINRVIQTNTKSVWNVRLGLVNTKHILVKMNGVGTLDHNHICEIRTIGFTIAERGMG